MLLAFPTALVFCPMDNYKKPSSAQGHGCQEFKLLQRACGKSSSSATLHWSKQLFMVYQVWGLLQPALKTKQTNCRLNEQTALVAWEFAARFFRGLKGCRYLVSCPGLPFEKCKGFFCKRFWTLLVLTVLVQAGNWTENFKSRLDKALQLRAEIQTAHESKPSVLAPANGFLPQWLTKGWDH